mmetsp:Transcript_110223/g.355445  ORF Transcript_110223/g.355445 Transcript_110223/m.355445 type:complete len:405 (-) Transcript_110223:291-1505(-)
MGYGTGVLRTYFAYYFVRGMVVGIAGTASLFIAQRTGVSQTTLVLARGCGMIVGPLVSSRLIGWTLRRGETQLAMATLLICKAIFALAMPRMTWAFGLYSAFFLLGVVMSVLDTLGIYLVTSVMKGDSGTRLSLYDACYGIGGMVAPFVTVAMPERVWDLLAVLDLCIALPLVAKRAVKGKPRDWQTKLVAVTSNAVDDSNTLGGDLEHADPVPSRIIQVGVAFTFISQIASTSVSAWGFTFASSHLGLPTALAAAVPSTFYFSSTVTRFIIAAVSRRVVPSAIMQASLLSLLMGAAVFWTVSLGISTSPFKLQAYLLLVGVGFMGAGSCPHYSFMLVSMSAHGKLEPRELAWYSTSVNLGAASGMVVPSLVSLPNVEMICAVALFGILSSNLRDFPWKQPEIK